MDELTVRERREGVAPHRLSIPWAMIAPHERQALRNHDQTLKRLAERGGLSPREAVCVLEGRSLRDLFRMTETEGRERLEAHVSEWARAAAPTAKEGA